jgi:hypothetical protein
VNARHPVLDGVDLRAAAIEYALGGWLAFPVNGKLPLTARGFRDATCDPVVIERMFADDRVTGIGIACGEAGLLVVDVDGFDAQGRWADVAACHGGHEPTLIAETGKPGGRHVYFHGNGPSSAGRLGPGIDTRGRGGYVIVPPSVHPSGVRYCWCDPDAAVAAAPDWLPRLLQRPDPGPIGERRALAPGVVGTAYGRAALHGLADDMLAAVEGVRNETLVRIAYRAGRLHAAGELDGDVARDVLIETARRKGLSFMESARTFASGFRAGCERPAVRASR